LKNNVNLIDQLVQDKFGSEYIICGSSKSPHADHYVLEKENIKKHLKVVKKSYLDQNEASEIDLLNSVTSDHVIKLEEYGELDSENIYLLFTHINGKTLDRLKDEINWDDAEIRKLGLDIVTGLQDLSRAGITHRDIKPKNIIRDEKTGKYIILDLGIGYFMPKLDKNKTVIVQGSGSRFYSAPEQFRVVLNDPYCITPATDQFSFAVILYELSTKTHPFISSNSSERQNYANAVTGAVKPLGIETLTNSLSSETISIINRMMSIEPSQRFLNLDELAKKFGSDISTPELRKPKLYLQMPNQDKDKFIEFLETNSKNIDGIVLSCSDTYKNSEKIKELGIEVLFDPKICDLILEDKKNDKSGSVVVKKLKLPIRSRYNICDLINMKEELLMGVYNYSKEILSEKIILPYFLVNDTKCPFLTFTKTIWDEAFNFYKKKKLDVGKIYGGIIIPHSIVINEEVRSVFLSQLMTKSPLDGIFVIIENNKPNVIATTTDEAYLKGIKHIANFFESMFDDVIFYRTDISILPFIKNGSFATGWSKGCRHFSFVSNGRRPEVYKMKYYASKLFTFIEEKTNINIIIKFTNDKSALACDCNYCKSNKPLELNYIPNEISERSHYFTNIIDLKTAVSSLTTIEEKNEFYKNYLEEAQQKGNEIKAKSGGIIGNEIIPSYKTLIALIHD
jgi:serine/threonine protein kinase